MRPASQRFFIHSCCYLRILIISELAMFLGTNSLSVLMCRKAVNQKLRLHSLLLAVGSPHDTLRYSGVLLRYTRCPLGYMKRSLIRGSTTRTRVDHRPKASPCVNRTNDRRVVQKCTSCCYDPRRLTLSLRHRDHVTRSARVKYKQPRRRLSISWRLRRQGASTFLFIFIFIFI